MDKPMSNFAFRLMSFGFKFRDIFLRRENILAEIGIKPGFSILDYGCGSGNYTIVAAQLVGGGCGMLFPVTLTSHDWASKS